MESGLIGSEKLKRSTDMTLGLIVSIFNILEIILIARVKKQKRKNFEIVLLSLSVADLLFGLSNAAVCVIYLIDPQMVSALEITYTTFFFFVLTSMLHLIFIGVDRVAAVVKPMKHKVLMTHKRLYRILVVIWLIATFTAGTLYVTNEKTDTFMTESIVLEENDTFSSNPTNSFRESSSSTPKTTIQNTAGNCILTNNTSNPSENQESQNPSNRTSENHKPPTPPIEKHYNNTNSTSAGCRPLVQVILLPIIRTEENFKDTMERLLSYVIIVADFVLVVTYAFLIFRMQRRKDTTQSLKQNVQKKQNERVSFFCMLVACVFVVFTLPYAFQRLMSGHAHYWVNILLVSNSALNCVVYFFRGYCEKKKSGTKINYIDHSPHLAGHPRRQQYLVKKKFSLAII